MAGTKARILILGAGFGGLYTALQAYRTLGGRAEITLLDRHDYFLFTPLLYQVVTGALRPHHVARPLVRLLPRGVQFVQTSVRAVDLAGRRVQTDAGSLPCDFLVLALGGVPNFYGLTSAERHALTFKWLPDALRLRSHIEGRFAEAEASPRRAPDLLRTVVTGAGCTGVELVSELYDWMRGPMLRRFPGVRKEMVTLILAEALDHLLCPMDPRLMRAAVRQLRARAIDVRLGMKVTEVGPEGVRVRRAADQETAIASGTVIWTAGIKGNQIVGPGGDGLVGRGLAGRIHVTETLQVPGHPEVLAIGDLAACPQAGGGILPATAQVAVQQAPAAARALDALLKDRTPDPFRYRWKGEVLGLGRAGALAEAFGFRLMGYPAWLLARTVHLARLPDWGDRVAVAWEWAKDLVKGHDEST